MVLKMFSIRDNKISSFGTPFFAPDEITAVRMMAVAQRDGSTNISQFPEDFELHRIGEFDNVIGKVTVQENSTFIIGAMTLRKQDEKLRLQAERIAQDKDAATPEHLDSKPTV